MPKEINTEILILSSPEKVWQILTNITDYPNWNPFIKSIEGELKVGNRLSVKIQPPNAKEMSFKPKLLVCDTNQELLWIGHLLFAGLFDGEHKFELIDHGNGSTTFRQSEKFTGILVWILNLENTKNGFESMNRKLKELAELK